MNPKDLVKQYLTQINVMQLATSVDDKPWVITVHFYADDSCNLYWISSKSREHSQHIMQNPNVAATIKVHENTPSEDYVIGITVQGKAELLAPSVDKAVSDQYLSKLAKTPSLIDEVNDPNGNDGMYILKPERIVLFDTKNFPNEPRQTVSQQG